MEDFGGDNKFIHQQKDMAAKRHGSKKHGSLMTTPSMGFAGTELGESQEPLLPEIIKMGFAKRWPRGKDPLSHTPLIFQGVRMSRKALG